jgi:hypothetical protein
MLTPTPPPSRHIPARPEWLEGWCGPVEWLDFLRSDYGTWVRSAYGAGGMANGAPTDRVRLDPSRPEVRDLLCRQLNLSGMHRDGPYAVPCAWWAGTTGRGVIAVCRIATNLYIGGDMVVIEAGSTPPFGFAASPERVIDAGCALLTGDGAILLPPLVAGGPPILWSSDAR